MLAVQTPLHQKWGLCSASSASSASPRRCRGRNHANPLRKGHIVGPHLVAVRKVVARAARRHPLARFGPSDQR